MTNQLVGTEDEAGAAAAVPAAAAARAEFPAREQVDCPLCGYDQSGALASIEVQAAWPMRGRCPECGLDWFWGDLLHPAKQLPRWFAENPKRFAPAVLVGTWRRALRPGKFWRSVLVTMPIHRGRLVLFAAVALLMSYVIAGAVSGWMEYQWGGGGTFVVAGVVVTSSNVEAIALASIWPFDLADQYWRERPLTTSSLVVVLWCLLMPLPFLVLRDTFMKVRIRRVHLLRIWSYSLAALPVLTLAFVGLQYAARWSGSALGTWWNSPTAWKMWVAEASSSVIGADWIAFPIVAIWLGWFWLQAIKRYLHLPNARAVVALMMLASFLAAIAIAMYLPGSTFSEQVGHWFVVW